MDTKTERMLMNTATGSVASESEWMADFERMSAEEWGGEAFEDAGLVEVVKNSAGSWVEAYPPLSPIS